MQNFEVINLAMKHAKESGNESALIRAKDAEWLEQNNAQGSAYCAAMQSLRHSIGIYHPDYKKAL